MHDAQQIILTRRGAWSVARCSGLEGHHPINSTQQSTGRSVCDLFGVGFLPSLAGLFAPSACTHPSLFDIFVDTHFHGVPLAQVEEAPGHASGSELNSPASGGKKPTLDRSQTLSASLVTYLQAVLMALQRDAHPHKPGHGATSKM